MGGLLAILLAGSVAGWLAHSGTSEDVAVLQQQQVSPALHGRAEGSVARGSCRSGQSQRAFRSHPCLIVLVLAACVCCLYVREKQGKPMFTNLETTNIAPSQTEMKAGTPAV